MIEKISKEEFISEVLKDDMESNKKDTLLEYKSLIENPDFSNKHENKIRFKLFNENGAFKGLLNFADEVKCFRKDIDQLEFFNLRWCPNGNKTRIDGIDIMTNKSRLFKDILKYLKNNNKPDKIVLKTLEDYFYGKIPEESKKRLFAYKSNPNLYVLDGNHRSGAIILAVSKNNLRDLFPIKLYVLEK